MRDRARYSGILLESRACAPPLYHVRLICNGDGSRGDTREACTVAVDRSSVAIDSAVIRYRSGCDCHALESSRYIAGLVIFHRELFPRSFTSIIVSLLRGQMRPLPSSDKNLAVGRQFSILVFILRPRTRGPCVSVCLPSRTSVFDIDCH